MEPENMDVDDNDHPASSSKTSAMGWLEQAQECQEQMPPDIPGAMEMYSKALQNSPEDITVLDSFGEFLCHQGQFDDARNLLLKAVTLCPNQGAAKYYYLGQMAEGREALEYFEKGLAIKEDEKESDKSARISALCSVAELFMTDLCDEPGAQEMCEKALAEGFKLGPTSIEMLASLALYKKIVGDLKSAKEHCLAAVGEIKKREDPDNLPNSEVRLNLCKTMIDCTLVDEVIPVLQQVLDEDDEDVQAWYLLCCAHLGTENGVIPADLDAVEECFERAVDICKKCPEKRECWEENFQAFREGPLKKLREMEDGGDVARGG